jgi:hypothetical protein
VQVVGINASDPMMVRLATSAGEIQAEWVGASPRLGQIDDVELDIEDCLALDATIFEVGRGPPIPDDPLMIRGYVEAMIADDLLELRIAGGLLSVQVEPATGRALSPGTHIALAIRSARVYPTGV